MSICRSTVFMHIKWTYYILSGKWVKFHFHEFPLLLIDRASKVPFRCGNKFWRTILQWKWNGRNCVGLKSNFATFRCSVDRSIKGIVHNYVVGIPLFKKVLIDFASHSFLFHLIIASSHSPQHTAHSPQPIAHIPYIDGCKIIIFNSSTLNDNNIWFHTWISYH